MNFFNFFHWSHAYVKSYSHVFHGVRQTILDEEVAVRIYPWTNEPWSLIATGGSCFFHLDNSKSLVHLKYAYTYNYAYLHRQKTNSANNYGFILLPYKDNFLLDSFYFQKQFLGQLDSFYLVYRHCMLNMQTIPRTSLASHFFKNSFFIHFLDLMGGTILALIS